MDLSGQLIAGTGTYVVSEISPPVESGQLLADNDFLLDDGSWAKGVGITILGGSANWDGSQTSTVDGSLIQSNVHVNGRTYTLKFKILGRSVGRIRARLGSTYAAYINVDGTYKYTYVADGTALSFYSDADFVGSIEWTLLEEVNEGAPLMDKGMKYLECTVDGSVAFASDQAYGEWEFDLLRESAFTKQYIYFIDSIGIEGTFPEDGYMFYFNQEKRIYIYAGAAGLFSTSINYITERIWYRIKITRTLDGEISTYIKGGEFGVDDWTLVDPSGGSGTNPVINPTYTTSKYFTLDLDAGDRIANIITRKAVSQ